MISVTLARRYARALLTLAEKQKELERTQTELGEWAAVFRRDPRVRRYFESPSISRSEKLSFLEQRIKPQVGLPIYGLLHVLLRRRRLDHLVAIGDEFEKLAEQARGIRRAVIRTAVPITDVQAQEVERVLARRTGLKIVLTREVDADVVGGAAVSLDHQVIDGTLATELWRIRQHLLQTRVHGRG
ncbi:MAG: ATP synthase F1 subunit delta [Candidatus Eiseniibacteriota bacterium]